MQIKLGDTIRDERGREGVITNIIRRKITTYKTMDEAGMLSPQAEKEYEKLQKLYPSMF